MMTFSSAARLLPLAAVPLLVACSGGDDVYVTSPDGPTDQNSAASQCIIVPGEDVCANLAKYSSQTPPDRTIDTIRALLELGRVAMSSATSLVHACASILDDLRIQRPQVTTPGVAGSPQWLADASKTYCDTAATAIRAQGTGLKVSVVSGECTMKTGPAPACGSRSNLPREECPLPRIAVEVPPGASPDQVALAKTLEKNLPEAHRSKASLKEAADATGRITGSADSIADLQASCVASFTQLATYSTNLVSSAASSAGTLLSAVQ